jgi:hypothetical protein
MPAGAQVAEGPPGDALILVQSELAYLEASDRRITVEVKGAAPANVLATIAKRGGFTLETQGKLPERPRLTASFRDATVRSVLEWFAEKVGVTYRTDRPDKLMVFPPEP